MSPALHRLAPGLGGGNSSVFQGGSQHGLRKGRQALILRMEEPSSSFGQTRSDLQTLRLRFAGTASLAPLLLSIILISAHRGNG